MMGFLSDFRVGEHLKLLDNTLGQSSKGTRIILQTLQESITRRKLTIPRELRAAHKLSDTLNCIEQRWPTLSPTENDQEQPIFIFSAGWRSGSTLVQRLVVSSGEVLIWGEPLGDAALIPVLCRALSRISLTWPKEEYFDDDVSLSTLSSKWIANLTPPISYLMSSHRSILHEWLGISVKNLYGLPRWGLKEVRLTIDHARYLKWLFPQARFIFVFRNLFDAYRSWKGNLWGDRWPGYFSRSPVVFARHWKLLLEGFINGYKQVDGLMIKFEDLISGKIDLDQIAAHIRVGKIDRSVLEKKVGSPNAHRQKPAKKINVYERAILSSIGRPLLNKLGYSAND